MGTVTRIDDALRTASSARRAIMPRAETRAARARRYRLRAEELRSISEEVMLKETCLTLHSLAESYDQMASVMEAMPCNEK
jgi:hypothetical protein